MDLFVY